MSDTPDNGYAEEDMISEDLLALLYPEEGDDSNADSTLDDQMQGMQGIRSLFAEMPDQDPPDAISNKLLALAAQHAPAPTKESKGFFVWISDLFLPLAHHPGLTAAASMVLVAGLAGTLYVNGTSKMAEPMAQSPSLAPLAGTATLNAPSLPQSDPTALQEEELAEGAAEMPLDVVTPQPALTKEKKLNSDERRDESRRQGALEALAKDKIIGTLAPAKQKGAKARIERSTSSLDESRRTKSAKKQTKNKGKTSYDSSSSPLGRGVDTRGSSPSSSSPPPPPPESKAPAEQDSIEKSAAPAPAPVQEAPRSSRKRSAPKRSAPSTAKSEVYADEDLDDSADEAPDPALAAAKLHKQALIAAKKGQCAQVKSLGRRIRTLSSSYYDRRFLSDGKLRACLAPQQKK